MKGINAGAYVRIPFSVSDVAALDSLSLTMRYNDGFVAYLNGTRVASANATPGHRPGMRPRPPPASDADAFVPQSFNLTSQTGLLSAGASNVLAIHGLNINAADDSFLVLPELLGGGCSPVIRSILTRRRPEVSTRRPRARARSRTPNSRPTADSMMLRSRSRSRRSPRGRRSATRWTDRSRPRPQGRVYTVPLTVDSTTTAARGGVQTGFDPTDVDTHTYLFLDDVITQPTSAPAWLAERPVNGQVYRYGMNSSVVNHGNPAIGGVAADQGRPHRRSPTISIVTDQANLTSAGHRASIRTRAAWVCVGAGVVDRADPPARLGRSRRQCQRIPIAVRPADPRRVLAQHRQSEALVPSLLPRRVRQRAAQLQTLRR